MGGAHATVGTFPVLLVIESGTTMSSLLDSVKSTFSTTPPAEEDTGDGDTFFTQVSGVLINV